MDTYQPIVLVSSESP